MKYDQLGPTLVMLGKATSSALHSAHPREMRQRLRVMPWLRARGDKTLRLAYDLTPESIVFDLGGYEGNWASDIFAMYRCQIYVFEPVPEYHDFITNRFRRNPSIRCFPFGLGPKDEALPIIVSGDTSSTFHTPRRKRATSDKVIQISIQRFSDFMSKEDIGAIDLAKINIEGGEYDLLDHVISEGLHHSIRNIQVQFHEFFPGSLGRMRIIQRQLAHSHYLTYQYPFVWENWRLSDAGAVGKDDRQ